MLMVAFDRGISVLHSAGLAGPTAVLAGVVLRGPLAVLSILPQAERDDREELLAEVRQQLGPAAYEHAMAQGAAMSDGDAVAYAIGELDRAETASPVPVHST